MKIKYQILILIFLSQASYTKPDSLAYQELDSLLDYRLGDVDQRIDTLSFIADSTYKLSEKNSEDLKTLLSHKTFLDIPVIAILVSLMLGVLASILTLSSYRILEERSLKKKFKYLEGRYLHIGENIRPNSYSNIIYRKGGKLKVETQTNYGNWAGRILMDKDVPNYGAGTFNYENRDEGGLLQIVVKDNDNIYIFPSTLTHEIQRINSYIMRREV